MFKRRKPVDDPASVETDTPETHEVAGAPGEGRSGGPWDVEEIDVDDEVDRVDLGSLLIAPVAERELRLQVDEASQTVQSVLIAGRVLYRFRSKARPIERVAIE